MIVRVDSKRRLTVPAALAPTSPGEYFDAHFAEEDALVFRRLAGTEDWLAVLEDAPSAWTMCLLAGAKPRGGAVGSDNRHGARPRLRSPRLRVFIR